MSITGRHLSLLYSKYKVSSICVLMNTIANSRNIHCMDDMCTLDAVNYLRNDAVSDGMFPRKRRTLFYIVCIVTNYICYNYV